MRATGTREIKHEIRCSVGRRNNSRIFGTLSHLLTDRSVRLFSNVFFDIMQSIFKFHCKEKLDAGHETE